MKFTNTKRLTKQQKDQIFELWNQEFPKQLTLSDPTEFEAYLHKLEDKNHIILSDEKGIVKGWLMYFNRNEERCFVMFLDPTVQGKGLGSKLLDQAKKSNTELNGWVIDHNTEIKQNGEKYISPIDFYKKNVFQIRREIVTQKEGIRGIKVIWKAE